MRKNGLIFLSLALASLQSSDQPGYFDVFTYQSPEFFTKTELPSRVRFTLNNSDTSFCLITLYKSRIVKADTNILSKQWNEYVVKKLSKSDKNPQRLLTGKQWEDWSSALAIGDYYQNKKKCVVMLNSFTKDRVSACVVYAFSDKSFKGAIEKFSNELHLNTIK